MLFKAEKIKNKTMWHKNKNAMFLAAGMFSLICLFCIIMMFWLYGILTGIASIIILIWLRFSTPKYRQWNRYHKYKQ